MAASVTRASRLFPRSSKTAATLLSAGLALAVAPAAFGYLGSFTPNDGYQIVQPWVDVSYFNAGQYGANAGGGSVAHIVPDSGLWKVTPGYAGGIYSSWSARQAALASAVVGNVYGVPPTAGGGAHYIVGDHGPGRTDNSALAFRNDTPNNAGPVRYDYTIDTYDTGGITPSTVSGGVVTTQYYQLASPAVPPGGSGAAPRDKFTMSFTDSSSAIGVQVGYAEDNEVYWRAGSSGPWTYTGLYVDTGLWDGVKVSIDLTADTFAIDYFVASTSAWQNLAPAGTPLGVGMGNLTTLGWQLEDNLPHGNFATKNFFDDFSFAIPAPGTAAFGLCGLALLRRRR